MSRPASLLPAYASILPSSILPTTLISQSQKHDMMPRPQTGRPAAAGFFHPSSFPSPDRRAGRRAGGMQSPELASAGTCFSPLLDTERIGFNLGQACSALRYRDAPLWPPSLLPSFIHDMLLPPNHPRRHKTEMSSSRFHNVTTCFLPQAQPTYTGRLGKWKKETNKHGNPSIPE